MSYTKTRRPRKRSASADENTKTSEDAPIYEVEFTFNPSLLETGLKEVRQNIESAKGYLFIAAINGSGELYDQQACAPGTLPENEPESRIVLGIQGQGWNHTFADVPAADVKTEGYFLIDKGDELFRWLKETNEQTTLHYTEAQDGSKTVNLNYSSGHDRIPIKMYYTEDVIGRSFQAHTHRFVSPTEKAKNPELAAMLSKAYKTAETTQSVDRSGDLTFVSEEGVDETVAEFMSVQRFNGQMIVTSQRAKIEDFPIDDLRWEVSPTDLSMLKDVFARECTASVETQSFDDDSEVTLFQVAYSEEFESGGTMYVQRQSTVVAKNQPLNRHAGIQILTREASALYASIETDSFFRQLRKTWALRDTAIIESVLQEATKEDPAHMRLQTYGGRGKDQSDQKRVQCFVGDSSIERYRYFKGTTAIVEKIARSSDYLQIRSYAVDGEEIESGYIVIPITIPEDEDFDRTTMTTLPEWPESYMFISWPQN